ncbi:MULTISPECIES: hypothetical protein [unclassified Kitasatospora]|uniref:hypothetical protein n=1 Tax=unclassified Kitasatospora TaxID=2633591 RepID=UPI000709C395|nr:MULTISPECIES: hypothetical protein [unclassified Kitasatospora]KQV04566.1 hypothetical protein ASC99_14290 [Kitasatospora sp. Root107]KRB60908.1 hypothetical protein ASE03_11220 [Kitasatospora sp. Root187]
MQPVLTSVYVTTAVERQLERDRLAELVAEHVRHHGEIPEPARAQAAAEAEEAERRSAQWLAEQRQDDAPAS